jgi:hypothetical protein
MGYESKKLKEYITAEKKEEDYEKRKSLIKRKK